MDCSLGRCYVGSIKWIAPSAVYRLPLLQLIDAARTVKEAQITGVNKEDLGIIIYAIVISDEAIRPRLISN